MSPDNHQDKDLFGYAKKSRKSKLEASFERVESEEFHVRVERIKYVESIMPTDWVMGLPSETWYVFQEAKDSFIYGQFVSTLMLAAAFIEHKLSGSLRDKGFETDADRGMKSILKCLKKNKSRLESILPQIQNLQDIRNPFVHLKPFDHDHNIGQRAMKMKMADIAVLEEDAKKALALMYTVAFNNVW